MHLPALLLLQQQLGGLRRCQWFLLKIRPSLLLLLLLLLIPTSSCASLGRH